MHSYMHVQLQPSERFVCYSALLLPPMSLHGWREAEGVKGDARVLGVGMDLGFCCG